MTILDRPVQDGFVINRLSVSPTTINLNIPRSYTKTVNIMISAGAGTTARYTVSLVGVTCLDPESGTGIPRKTTLKAFLDVQTWVEAAPSGIVSGSAVSSMETGGGNRGL